jgi:hypothetical protein
MARPNKFFDRLPAAQKAAKTREHKVFKVEHAFKSRKTGKAQKDVWYYVDGKDVPKYVKKNKAYVVTPV